MCVYGFKLYEVWGFLGFHMVKVEFGFFLGQDDFSDPPSPGVANH